jgi:hypothetical protein
MPSSGSVPVPVPAGIFELTVELTMHPGLHLVTSFKMVGFLSCSYPLYGVVLR